MGSRDQSINSVSLQAERNRVHGKSGGKQRERRKGNKPVIIIIICSRQTYKEVRALHCEYKFLGKENLKSQWLNINNQLRHSYGNEEDMGMQKMKLLRFNTTYRKKKINKFNSVVGDGRLDLNMKSNGVSCGLAPRIYHWDAKKATVNKPT